MPRPMKNSGIEWLGDIPTDWDVQRIKNVAQIYGRIGFRGYTTDDLVEEGEGAITLSPSNLRELKIVYDKCSYISWEKYEESPEIQIENGDILFVKTGSSYGKSSIVNDLPLQATINPQLVVFKNITINNRFLLYFLQTPSIRNEIEGIVSGGTIPTMTQDKMKNFHICIPPLDEQQRIANFLDDKCARIDSVIENTRASIEEYKKLKQSIITRAVTKGIRPNRPMKNSGIEWIGDIPSDWTVCRIKNLANIFTGNSIKDEQKEFYEEPIEAIPYIATKDIDATLQTIDFFNGMYVKISDESFKRAPAQSTLLCIEGGSAGKKIAYTNREVCFVNKLCCFHSNTCYNEYVYYYLMSSTFTQLFNSHISGLIGGVSVMTLKNFKIILPSPDEQREIANYLDEKTAAIDSLVAKKNQLVTELERLKKSLIFEYVTGKKEVPT